MNTIEFDNWWNDKLIKPYVLQAKHNFVLSLLREEDFPLVDLGAGNGVFIQSVENKFPHSEISGVELSDIAINNKLCQSQIKQGSILNWVPEGELQTVTLIDVIEHLTDPKLLLNHVAKYSHQIIIACPNFNFFKARVDVLLGKIPFQNKPSRGGHVYWCQYDNLLQMFSECNLRVMQEHHIYPRHSYFKFIGRMKPSLFAHEFVFRLKIK